MDLKIDESGGACVGEEFMKPMTYHKLLQDTYKLDMLHRSNRMSILGDKEAQKESGAPCAMDDPEAAYFTLEAWGVLMEFSDLTWGVIASAMSQADMFTHEGQGINQAVCDNFLKIQKMMDIIWMGIAQGIQEGDWCVSHGC